MNEDYCNQLNAITVMFHLFIPLLSIVELLNESKDKCNDSYAITLCACFNFFESFCTCMWYLTEKKSTSFIKALNPVIFISAFIHIPFIIPILFQMRCDHIINYYLLIGSVILFSIESIIQLIIYKYEYFHRNNRKIRDEIFRIDNSMDSFCSNV